MTTTLRYLYLIGLVGALGACAQQSQSPVAAAPAAPAPAPASGATTPPAVEALYVYFDADSAKLNKQAEETADQAARLYREGNPNVMKIVGHTDATGDELYNLYLSARRANAVKAALVARGIPAPTLELQAAGESDRAATDANANPQDRRAVITWR